MEIIGVDQSILADRVHCLKFGLHQVWSEMFKERQEGLESVFSANAQAAVTFFADITRSLEVPTGSSIIDVINRNNEAMLCAPTHEGDFGHEPLDPDHDCFVALCDKQYVHKDVEGFFGGRDHRTAAVQAVRDYLEASVMFLSVCLKKQGMPFDSHMPERIVSAGARFIDFDLGGESAKVINLQQQREARNPR